MKKLNLFLFLLLFLSLSSFADWKAKMRPQCYWWRAKYMAEANLSGLERDHYLSNRVKNCDGVQALVKKKETCTYGPDSAYCWSWSYPPFYYGGIGKSVTNGCIYQLAGADTRFENSKFKNPPLTKSIATDDPIAYQENKIMATDISFNNNTKQVILTNLSGYVVVENSENINNGYTVAILRIQTALADSLLDSLESDIIWEGKIIIANGTLTLSGQFNSTNLTITEIPITNGKKYSFSASSFTITLPENTDMDNIEAEFSGDCGEAESGISGNFLTGNEKIYDQYKSDFDYTVYPNPTTDRINIRVITQKEKIKKIYIKNLQGQMITIIRGTIKPKNGILPIECDNLPKGVYFIGIEVGSKVYYRKFIVQ
ncbi:MAG: T9SS type A sorting domain-containing protein [Bacteroidia bacterium]|nr:T9SS type A sorting domain-containing protein [Bacteroidia bacterium]